MSRFRSIRPIRILTALALGSLATVAAACGSDDPNEVKIEGHEFAFEVDGSDFVRGTNTITFENTGTQTHHLQLVQIGPHTLEEALAGAAALGAGEEPPDWFIPRGGVGQLAPGESASITDSFAPGNYALLCFVPDIADGVPHLAKGMAALITIAGDQNDADIPEADFTVSGVDSGDGSSYGFEGVTSVDAGEVTVRFRNGGSELHEANLFKLAPGFTVEQLVGALTAEGPPPAGPPPFTPVGALQAMLPGSSQTATLDLEAGTYVFICFVPNPQGVPHFALGMVQELTVN